MATEQNDSPRLKLILIRVRQVVDYLFCVGYGLIGLQIILDLAGAHNESGFKSFLNRITHPFLGPFEGIFSDPVINNCCRVRISYFVALVIYSLVHLAVYYFFRLLEPKR
ncbi:MAG: hypothetical protein U0V70_05895 [Terriglobia bacterium]